MTEQLLALFATLAIAIVLPIIMIVLSASLGGPSATTKHKEQARKLEPYESGVTVPILPAHVANT